MKKHDVVWTPEIGNALAEIAEEIMDGTSKKTAAQTLFLYHHRRQLYQAKEEPAKAKGVYPIEKLPKHMFTRIIRYIL